MTMRHKSLTQVLEAHYRNLLSETSVTESVFVANVREHYERTVPPHADQVEWSQNPDLVTRMRRDAEKLSRWFREDIHARFPLDVLESFIFAFPPDRRFDLQQDLAHRQDLLAVPIPKHGAGEDGANLGRIGKEVGEAIIAVSAMLGDGIIDKRDAPVAADAVRQLDEAIAVVTEMRERIIRQALDHKQSPNH